MKSVKRRWRKFKPFLGPAFVLLEAGMHVYLFIYLTFNWANAAIWIFTGFEMVMFGYLLANRKKELH